MVTIYFKPGDNKLLVVKAIKETLHLSLKDARDAADLGRITCYQSDRDRLVKAIEDAGGKLT